MSGSGVFVTGLAIAVGLVGIVVPILPGTLLVLGAIVVWAVVEGGAVAWVGCSLAIVVLAIAQVLKYTVPGRGLRAGGVPTSTVAVGAGLGIVGFFVIPVVGLAIGFVVGVYVMEWHRLGYREAWPSTVSALKAVGVSLLIELAGGLVAAVVWLGAVVAVSG